MTDLETDLAAVLNAHSIDNRCQTPAFMLARHLIHVLTSIAEMQGRRTAWFTTGDVPPPMETSRG